MPDYRKMYLTLARAAERAARLLRDAQTEAEQLFCEAAPPPLRLPDPDSDEDFPGE